MSLLDVDSLFTDILLSGTIEICFETVLDRIDEVDRYDRDNFCTLLTLAVTDLYFMFGKKYISKLMVLQWALH